MENVFIKNPVVIKEVAQDKTILKEFEKGKEQVYKTVEELSSQTELLRDKIEESHNNLSVLMNEKEELQGLIIGGNAGLTSKLLETERKIKQAEEDIKQAEEDLNNFTILEDEQAKLLERALYDEFIGSDKLRVEYVQNIERLQLQYYSLLYKAFEVAHEMMDLEEEYFNAVRYAFRNAHPYKSFIDTFSHKGFINAVKNNFPQYNLHKNPQGQSYIDRFVNKFETVKDKTTVKLYK